MSTLLSAKEREHRDWIRAAAGWKKHDARIRASSAPVTERMLQAARVGADDRVLDVACGTGEPALSAAEQVGPCGYVLGTDFVEEMLAFARKKAARSELANIDFRRVDGEELEVRAASFDAVLIRWGIMFMFNPTACLARARAAVRAGGRVSVACWAEPDRNPWAAIPLSILARHEGAHASPPDAPGIFSFADPRKLRLALEEAGFADVELDEVHLFPGGQFDEGRACFRFVREVTSSIARRFSALPPKIQREVEGEVAREAEAHRWGTKVGVPGVTWVASGRR